VSNSAQGTDPAGPQAQPRPNVVASLGLIAALAMLVGATCCVLPLFLASLGLAGAWIANLGIFVVYRPYITGAAFGLIALGWALALRRRASRRTFFILGCATGLVIAALALAEYEPQLTRYLVSLRRK
jgi:mercuric ion transport protein